MDTTNFRNVIPYLSDVDFIIKRMSPRNSLKAILHLMLPAKSSESIEVDYSKGVSWRGASVSTQDLSIKNIRKLVESRIEKDDVFLSCLGLTSPLLKPIKTGSSYFFFGSDCLYSLPLIFINTEVSIDEQILLTDIIHNSFRVQDKKSYLESEFKINKITTFDKGPTMELFFKDF